MPFKDFYKQRRMEMKKLFLVSITATLVGCATGTTDYTPPANYKQISNQKILNKSLDKAWKDTVSNLSKDFFVINNLDKSSGLINVSFSGNPEQYIDCGEIYSKVSNAVGTREYRFAGSAQNAYYEVWDKQNINLIQLNRQLALDGRINLILQAKTPNQTLVTANVKYVLNRKIDAVGTVSGRQFIQDSISFTSRDSAVFPGSNTSCKANGKLEQLLLDTIN